MNSIRLALTTIVLIILSNQIQAQEKWSRVKIFVPTDPISRAELIGQLEIDHFDTDEKGAIVSEINESSIQFLNNKAYRYEILVPDVVKQLDSLNRIYYASINKKKNNMLGRVAIEQPGSTLDYIIPKPAAFEVKSTFGGYYRFAEMEAAMNTLVTNYSAIAQRISIGKTAEGRDIWVIKISDNVGTDEANEPELLYMGLQHAREAITGASMIFFMQYLCEQYGKDARIKDLVNNREIYIIPCFNPDGWEHNYTLNTNGGGGWRKNRSKVDSVKSGKSYSYTYGVDLNRNWGVDWANCSTPIKGSATSCGSGTKSDDTYWGASAFSELETQAVRNFTKERHIAIGFDQHAFGPYYSLPFGRQSLHLNEMPQKGIDFFTAIPALMGKYNGMRAADSYDALGYEVAGGFKDWMLMGEIGATSGTGKKDTVWAITGEGGAGGGTGGTYGSFWAPASQIVNLCKGMTYQNLQLAFAAGSYVDIQDVTGIAMSSATGDLSFRVKRLGLGNEPVRVILVPLENVQVGGMYTIPSMTYYEDYVGSVSYSLFPGIKDGQRIKFAWKVETGGYTYADTIVKFYNPQTLISDNMEGSNVTSGWTVTGGWNYSTDDKFGGTQSLTESPKATFTNGIYNSSTSAVATNNNIVNIAGSTAAYLTFWTKYRAENFRDKLQVQVSTNSTDGSNGTWTTIAGKHTVQEPGTLDGSTINGAPSLTGIRDYWTQEVFDLTPYNNSSSLRFRFVFSSNVAGGSFKYQVDDGFYIDNIEVIKTNASLTTLPVEFLSFSGKLLPDNKVQLTWEAATDAQHDYFEVQRSGDGNNFESIGKINTSAPFQLTDRQPKSGNNFYRIKQVDKDGTISYSKIINVYIESSVKVLVYPNPVQDVVTVTLGSREERRYKVQITNLQGKVVYEVVKAVQNNSTEIKVDMRGWQPQMYILQVLGRNNEIIEMQKVLKL